MGDHYVPQYYLRGFAEDDRLWVYDRKDGRKFETQPKSIANETGMYGEDLETVLANEIEHPAKPAIEKVRARQRLDAGDREALARYVVMLWKRVPRGRERVVEGMPEIVEDLRKRYAADFVTAAAENPSLADRAALRTKELHAVLDKFLADPYPIWRDVLKKEHTSTNLVDVLLKMNWRFLCSSRLQFLTCDNPVFIFESEGIGKPESELSIPFSDSVTMLANWRAGGHEFITARPEGVRVMNRRTANNATRFVYARRSEDWIAQFAQKAPHRLDRLR